MAPIVGDKPDVQLPQTGQRQTWTMVEAWGGWMSVSIKCVLPRLLRHAVELLCTMSGKGFVCQNGRLCGLIEADEWMALSSDGNRRECAAHG